MKAEVQEKLEAAVGMVWADYRDRHPNIAAGIERDFGGPVDIIVKRLDEGPEYQELLSQTEAETNVANIAQAVGPIVLSILGKVIGG